MKIKLKHYFFLLTFLLLGGFFITTKAEAACSGSHPNWTAATWVDVQFCNDSASVLAGHTIT